MTNDQIDAIVQLLERTDEQINICHARVEEVCQANEALVKENTALVKENAELRAALVALTKPWSVS